MHDTTFHARKEERMKPKRTFRCGVRVATMTVPASIAAILLALSGCGIRDTTEAPSFADGCMIDSASTCSDCLQFTEQSQLGTLYGPGYLTEAGQAGSIVRDHVGNYWVGQGAYVNVYDSTGVFAQQVGRLGQGPLEFSLARPRHVDGYGRIHIQDNGNMRVSVVDAEFGLVEEKRLPLAQINDMVALDDGSIYAIQAWGQDTETFGFPIHLINDEGIFASFGIGEAPTQPIVDTQKRLAVAADKEGNVYSMPEREYVIEAWSQVGERLGRLEGPTLNRDTDDSETPPNMVRDLHVDGTGRVWVTMAYRRPSWRQNSVEVVDNQGDVMQHPRDMDGRHWFQGRIDLLDLQTCSLLASELHDDIFFGFVTDGLVASPEYTPDGAPVIKIKRVKFKRGGKG